MKNETVKKNESEPEGQKEETEDEKPVIREPEGSVPNG